MDDSKPKAAWKHALIPAIVVAFLAIYPQLSLWVAQGSNWHGAYYVSNYDEVAYSAYVNALVNGKPWRNDPFTGNDDPAHESLYSIQFIPAYTITIPTRLFGISTSTAFVLLSVLVAIASSLALFWLINSVTGKPMISSAGTLVVLCMGTAAAYQGELRYWTEGRVLIDFLPFLRRYQPGFAFPIFLVFCVFVWRSFTLTERKRNLVNAVLSGGIFAVLIYSYFYLWTAAAAWLGSLAIVNLIWNNESRIRVLSSVGVIGSIGIVSLIPYSKMLADRSPNLDSVQLLTNTHAPHFASPTLIIGLLIAASIGVLALRGKVKIGDSKALLTISFALTPLVLLNQNVLTGRSLQPVHYEIFIANYLALIAAVLLTSMLIRNAEIPKTPWFRNGLVYLAVIAAGWGMVEVASSTERNSVFAEIRDKSIPAIRYIEQDSMRASGSANNKAVLATNFVTSDFIPTVSTLRPLWNSHTSSVGGVSVQENKRLFYLYLYCSGYSGRDLEEALRQNSFEVTAAIFGTQRSLPALTDSANQISAREIQEESKKYTEFAKNLSGNQSSDPALSYLIVPAGAEPNFSNLDRLYKRDEGKTFGLFKVYGLTPKTTERPVDVPAAQH